MSALIIYSDEPFCPVQLACHSIFFLLLGSELLTDALAWSMKKFVLFSSSLFAIFSSAFSFENQRLCCYFKCQTKSQELNSHIADAILA